MSEFTFSEWQWNESKQEWQFWHEPSNLILVVRQLPSDGGWIWEIREYTGDFTPDGLDAYEVVAAWEDDLPFPLVSKEAAQQAALAWLERE